MAFTGAVPINQLNSLPLFSSDQYAFGGSVTIFGGSVNRYFSPAQTGINGAAMNVTDTDSSGAIVATPRIVRSALLDVRGCKTFTCLAAIKMGAVAEDVAFSLTLRIQSPAAADVASVIPKTGNCGDTAWPIIGSFLFPVATLGAYPGYKSAGRGWMVGGHEDGGVQTGSLGFIYLWFAFANAAGGQPALLYVSLYGST